MGDRQRRLEDTYGWNSILENDNTWAIMDDILKNSGKPEALKWMQGQLEKKYTVKTQTLGPGKEDQQCRGLFESQNFKAHIGWETTMKSLKNVHH